MDMMDNGQYWIMDRMDNGQKWIMDNDMMDNGHFYRIIYNKGKK